MHRWVIKVVPRLKRTFRQHMRPVGSRQTPNPTNARIVARIVPVKGAGDALTHATHLFPIFFSNRQNLCG
jgi:hypothetical protein